MTKDNLIEILMSDKPSEEIKKNEKEIFDIIPDLENCKGCEQNSPWHVYDVYDHIMHVIDNVEKDEELRMCALFHDLGKPDTKETDKYGIDHFPDHWFISKNIFENFAKKYNYDEDKTKLISKLIFYHDLNIGKLDDKQYTEVISNFKKDEIIKLYKFKRADLLAQNKECHYLLDEYDKQEKNIRLIYERSNIDE